MGAWHRPHKQTGAWQRARCSYSSARGAGKPFAAHPFCFSPQCSLHLFPVHGIIANRTYYKWRSDREAEGARLLSEYAPQGHLGFESLLLRHDLHSPRNRGGFFAQSTAGDFARASPCSNAIEPRKVQRQGPILAQIDALFNRRRMRAGVDGCSKAKPAQPEEVRKAMHRCARGRAKGTQTQTGAARERGPERHHAGHRRRVGERTGYFLNFHHLKPETFSGFLR